LSVGGADASQKGFGDVMPAIVQRRSAMFGSLGLCFILMSDVWLGRGALAIR
jgi:hypothetical protein